MFLAGNGIRFYEQTEDAWYRGTGSGYRVTDLAYEGSRRIYWPEEAASPLGCVSQYQFCNTALAPGKQCGPLAGRNDAIAESGPLFNNTGPFDDEFITSASATANQFVWLILQLEYAATRLVTILETLGPASLASKQNLIQGFMGRLPPNQWQLDVTHWWSTYLASLQSAFVDTAIGPADPTGELEQFKIAPWNNHVRRLCNNQVSEHLSGFHCPAQIVLAYVISPMPINISRLLNPLSFTRSDNIDTVS